MKDKCPECGAELVGNMAGGLNCLACNWYGRHSDLHPPPEPSRRQLADWFCASMSKYLIKAEWVGDENLMWIDPLTKYSHNTMTAMTMQLDRDLGKQRK